MRVIYKKTVEEGIKDIIEAARRDLKAIEKIILTREEAHQLEHQVVRPDLLWADVKTGSTYMGISLEVE